MGQWSVWKVNEKKKALELRKCGKKVKEIADMLHKTVNAVAGYFKRVDRENGKPKGPQGRKCKPPITEQEEENRIRCYKIGLTDKESADECKIARSTYTTWRVSKGLPPHETIYMSMKPIKTTYKTKHFEASDINYYRHNENKVIDVKTKSEVKVIIDRELAQKMLDNLGVKPTNLKLADGPQGSHMGVVIGSQWENKRELSTTAKQDTYANTVKRLVKHG